MSLSYIQAMEYITMKSYQVMSLEEKKGFYMYNVGGIRQSTMMYMSNYNHNPYCKRQNYGIHETINDYQGFEWAT